MYLKPAPRLVTKEADISDLIPGDRVKAVIGNNLKWIAYVGMEGGKCMFLDPTMTFHGLLRMYETELRTLQFLGGECEGERDGGVWFDHLHTKMQYVLPNEENYERLKRISEAVKD